MREFTIYVYIKQLLISNNEISKVCATRMGIMKNTNITPIECMQRMLHNRPGDNDTQDSCVRSILQL